MKNICLLLFTFSILTLQAQNRSDFFKVPQQASEEMPVWAQNMYSDDPNVWEVDWEYERYFQDHSFAKNLHTQNYRHWRRFVEPYISEQGLIRLPSTEEERNRIRIWQDARTTEGQRDDVWQSLGPIETYAPGGTLPISWHANVYSIDQSLSHPDILYAGTEGGGVFKSVDHGINWELVSKNEGFSNGMTAVGIHPEDPDRVIVAGNRRLYQTTDGGDSWNEVLFLDGSGYEVRYHPQHPDTIFVASGEGLYRSNDGGSNWTTVFINASWDIEFHPTDPTILYTLLSVPGQNRTAFYRSTDTGENWELITAGWYEPENEAQAAENGGKIAVTVADPDRVYVCLIGASKAGDDGWIGIFRSNDTGQNWFHPADQIGGPYNSPNSTPWNVAAYSDGYHQGFYNFDLEVSQSNPDRLWVGTIRLSESGNGGANFQSIGAANSNRLDRIHADIQDIEVNDDEIWVASDGGINFSTDEMQSHESRKYGIIASDFWGFGSGWNEDVLVGGKYHNGNSAFYQTYPAGKYLHVGGVEESTGYVNPLQNRRVYFNQYWTGGTVSQLIPETFSGPVLAQPSVSLIPNESYVESSSSGLYFDPRYADHIYIGQEDKIWKSTNGGGLFEALHDFGDGKVLEIAIARSNPEVLYAVFQPGGGYWDWCEVHRSTDGGHSWSAVANIPGNRWRLNIAVNPQNKDELWISSSSGGNGEKVFRSTDSGNTWTNLTSSLLDEQRPKDLYFQEGTEDLVYLATNQGVFYWQSDTEEWISYSAGLPFISSSLKMAPFYPAGKIRLATYGRGIWEAPLAGPSMPIAQPMTSSDQVYCSRDTVDFDSYSVIEHAGASWEWTFSPTPAYVSDSSVRNPKVVFGDEGTYSVSLSITNAAGETDTRTEANMVTVSNFCEPDTIPGLALETMESGDWAQTNSLDITTNTFTITAWVKPSGTQAEYTGIVMNDEEAAGFNFREANNTLAYHWPGGAWWWDSGLTVDPDEWSYVAMVARPDGMTVYVNGVAAHHDTDLDPAYLGTLKMGSYQGWGGRNYRGLIDEVTLWNRSLSTEEIRRYRHITREKLAENDEGLLAYYQFNEPEGKINDRIGSAHAILSGNATRAISTAPVGGGMSQHITLAASPALTVFDSVGIIMDLTNSGASGEVVVSRINQAPVNHHNIGYLYDSVYWVANHYGDAVGFDFPYIGIRPPTSFPQSLLNNPGEIQYSWRSENSDEADYIDGCTATSVYEAGNEVGFSNNNGCLTTSFGQFTLLTENIVRNQSINREERVRVFPNPTVRGRSIRVDIEEATAVRIQLFNADGKLCLDRFVESDGQVQLGDLAAGVYFFRLRSDQFMRHGQLIIGE